MAKGKSMAIDDTEGSAALASSVNPTIANWQAFNEGLPWLGSGEFPLYTDARVTGEIELGPYQFLNTVAVSNNKTVKSSIVLRYAFHKTLEHPTFTDTDASLYHGGSPPEELAALASLCLGIRLRAGRSIRRFEPNGDPKGRPEEIGDQVEPYFRCSSPPVVPSAVNALPPLELIGHLSSLLTMPVSKTNALIRAARLYQEALWLCEAEPALSWLLLVSAVEAAATQWHTESGDPIEQLKRSKRDLFDYLQGRSDESLLHRVASAFSDTSGATQKFVKFCLKYGPPPPAKRPVPWAQFNWATPSFRKALSKIYDYRSRALHDGRPFPAPMCDSPRSMQGWEAPSETMSAIGVHQSGSTWLKKDVPFHLHIFEYIARSVILEWWKQSAALNVEKSFAGMEQRQDNHVK